MKGQYVKVEKKKENKYITKKHIQFKATKLNPKAPGNDIQKCIVTSCYQKQIPFPSNHIVRHFQHRYTGFLYKNIHFSEQMTPEAKQNHINTTSIKTRALPQLYKLSLSSMVKLVVPNLVVLFPLSVAFRTNCN